MANIGVISDTHGLLRPEAIKALSGSDFIIHAGDIGSIDVIDQLANIAPVTAIRGNVDKPPWGDAFAEEEVLELDGLSIYIIHNIYDLDLDPIASGFKVVVSGHSHKPNIERHDGVLYVNPGSAGPRRFSLPIAVATLEVNEGNAHAKIIELAS